MTEEDFRQLVMYLKKQLREAGLSELADERNYTRDYGDGPVVPKARIQVLEMLDAFGRHLSVRDRATYESAMKTVLAASDGVTDARAVVERPRREGADLQDEIDLSRAPDLRRLRKRLVRLMIDVERSLDEPIARF